MKTRNAHLNAITLPASLIPYRVGNLHSQKMQQTKERNDVHV